MTEVIPGPPNPLIYPESHSHNPLPYDETALGRAAVLAVEDELKYAAEIEALPADAPSVTDAHINHLAANILKKDSLKEIHEDLELLADNYQSTEYLNRRFAKGLPRIFVDWRARTTQPPMVEKSWANWLAEDATDDQILNVLQWSHEHIYHYNTDPEFQQKVEQRRAEYLESLEKVQAAGYIHPDGWEGIKDTVASSKIYAADIFQLAKRSSGGVKVVETNEMLMLPERLIDKETTTFEHELSHFVEHDERWIDELGADLLAGMTRTGSLDPKVAFERVHRNPNHGYRDLDNMASKVFINTPQKVKAFLRYYSAPPEQEGAARKELSLVFTEGASADIDILGIIGEDMSSLLPSHAPPTREQLAA